MALIGNGEERPVGACAFNGDQSWAYRLTWDRSAFELAYPEFTFGRANSREQVEKLAVTMSRFQTPGRAPLLAVSVLEPGAPEWVAVWRWPLRAQG